MIHSLQKTLSRRSFVALVLGLLCPRPAAADEARFSTEPAACESILVAENGTFAISLTTGELRPIS